MIVTDPRVFGFHVIHDRVEVALGASPPKPAGMAVVGARRSLAEVLPIFLACLEAVMNSIRNGLGMRKARDCGGPSQPENPHPNAVFTQVHNTL